MKQLIFLLLIPPVLSAQTRQGAIVYERKIDLHRRLKDDQIKAMVPQFQTAVYEVLFKDSIVVYKAMPKDEAPDPFDNNTGNGAHINMRFNGPGDDGIVYRNYGSGRLLEEAMLEEKKYIISDTLKPLDWKLSGGDTIILGHDCKKATTTTPRGSKVVAWYTGDIPLPAGPDQFNGLPGAILKVDAGEGEVVFTAKEIQDKVEGRDLKAPGGGRVISRADYVKKMNEVLGPPDSQGRRIIRN
ncbi:GLPGLI family protein [Puia sp.]|jgi:GLPGLI family protein|uniref:GLPGLI family protein n=1 Tax=Puia sp. TaxID=2045100 RepID=UPI002F4174FE